MNKFLINIKNLEADLDEPLKVQLNTPKIEEELTPTENQSVEKRQEFKTEIPASLPFRLSDTRAEAVKTIPPKISNTTRNKKEKLLTRKDQFHQRLFLHPLLYGNVKERELSGYFFENGSKFQHTFAV